VAPPTWLDLDGRRGVLDRLLEDIQRVAMRALLDQIERVVDDTLGERTLAVIHNAAHYARDVPAVVFRIRDHEPVRRFSSSRHTRLPPQLPSIDAREH
jgi:hypothetical protein